ncbi:MAG: DUF6644 family protein [Candidatus Acidiferrales bacterium]|jgi:hypothetical protein
MTLFHLCQWLYASSFGTAIRESQYGFPLIETAHVLGITVLVGTVAIVDLRLLGLVMKREPVSDVLEQVLPLTWGGFVIMFVSGSLLLLSKAELYYGNPLFRIKLGLLLLAGLNPLIFHSTVYRSVSAWGESQVTPKRAKLAAVLSLTLWSAIVVTGRAIAYFH